MMSRLQQVNFQQVQIIGTEGIAAGKVLPGSDPCFFHGKLSQGRIDVLIKCKDAVFAQKICDLVCQTLR